VERISARRREILALSVLPCSLWRTVSNRKSISSAYNSSWEKDCCRFVSRPFVPKRELTLSLSPNEAILARKACSPLSGWCENNGNSMPVWEHKHRLKDLKRLIKIYVVLYDTFGCYSYPSLWGKRRAGKTFC
jgi:hypothetical protein